LISVTLNSTKMVFFFVENGFFCWKFMALTILISVTLNSTKMVSFWLKMGFFVENSWQ
jgi:hypothetical protein